MTTTHERSSLRTQASLRPTVYCPAARVAACVAAMESRNDRIPHVDKEGR